ncbi:MAG: ABC transporter permease [Promethearchaeota archaeon]
MSIKKIYRNIFYSLLIAILMLFLGLIISFIITKVIPVDPVEELLPIVYTQEQYDAMEHHLGFDKPLIVQFFRYIGDFFTGNWGTSYSLAPGVDVLTLMKERFPRMIELLILPVIVGVGVGILFGKIAIIYKDKWADKVIRILAILGISAPVFWLSMFFQYVFSYQLEWFPAFGFKSGDLDYYIMPMSILTIAISSLITLQTRSTLESEPIEKSVISNTFLISKSFGFIIMFYILTAAVFAIHGIEEMLIDTLYEKDVFSLSGILFALITTLVIGTFIANLIISLYRYISVEVRTKRPVLYNEINEEEVNNVG